MIIIKNFLIEGKKDRLIIDNFHPTFSFVIDYEKVLSDFKKAELIINGHIIDVSNLTRYQYEYDDLRPLTEYEASINAYFDDEVNTHKLKFQTGLKEWTSPFITHPTYRFKEKKVSPKVISFKRDFSLLKRIKKCHVYVTCFGVYNIYINNKKINEEYLLPGFTSYKHQLQYQFFDITNNVKTINYIRVDVAGGWAVGSYVMNRVNRISENKQSLSLKILIEYIDGTKEEIESNDLWFVSINTPYLDADLYDGEMFDATKNYDNYVEAKIIKPRSRPLIKAMYGEPIVKINEIVPTYLYKSKNQIIYDLKQNIAGVIFLHIKKAVKGQKIIVHHAEILNHDKSLNTSFLRSAKARIEYICKDGEQIYSPTFTYMGFRYISIEGIDRSDIEVKALVLSSNLIEKSTFECDNKLINRLNENIRYSSLANFLDIPTDCPQRDERMGWTGDIAVFAPTALYNLELEAFLKKWLLDLRSEQLKTGGVPNTIPSQGYGFPLTMPKMAIDFWGDASLMVPFSLFKATGDINIIKESYSSMKKYVNACLFWAHLLSFGHRRYIWHTPAIFHFGDWIAPDVSKMSDWQKRSIYTATASLKNTSSILVEAAKILNKKDDVDKYSKIINKIDAAFNKVLTDGNGIIKKEFQTGYVLPIYLNIFKGEAKQNALKRLVKIIEENNYCIGTGFPGTPYILFALADNGYQDVAYKMLLNDKCPSWLYEVKVGATSIWERWDGLTEEGESSLKEDGTGGMISYNHYASGAVGNFLYTRLAGLEMIEPGYKLFKVKPILAKDINYVKTSTLSPYGDIKVEYHKKDKFYISVRVPLRSKCILELPNKEKKHLTAGEYQFECVI